VSAILVVGCFAAYMMLKDADQPFDHKGKIATGDAANFQPSLSKFPSGFAERDLSDFTNTSILPSGPVIASSGYASFSKKLYTDSIPVSPTANTTRHVVIEILVFDSVDDAKAALHNFFGEGNPTHDLFEWCFSLTDSAYLFRDMNVLGSIAKFGDVGNIPDVLKDIENKIHAAA
jgi:hypothetical protein